MTLPLHGFQDWQNPLHTGDLQTDVSSTNVNGGNQFTTGVFDMRPYQTASIMFSALSNVIPKTQFGHVDVQVLWYANAAGTQIIYQDRYPFFPQGAGGAFATDLGRVMLRCPVMGPYMTLQFSNNGADQVAFAWRILGNTKPCERRHLINTDINGHTAFNRDAGQLVSINANLGAGLSTYVTVPIYQGVVGMRLQAVTQPFIFQFTAPDGSSIQGWNIAAGSENHQLQAYPRMGAIANVINTGAGNGTGVWEVSCNGQVW